MTEMVDGKLALLRARMAEAGVDALVCGSADAHQSEYVPDRDQRRVFISEFSGSAGTALILADSALLWTDGRYFLQASLELSKSWTLMKSGEKDVLEMNLWICKNMPVGSVVGVDSSLIAAGQALDLVKEFEEKKITLKAMTVNLVDYVWNQVSKQPDPPMGAAIVQLVNGHSHISKIKETQIKLAEAGAGALIVSMLDEVMWLFNLRGADVECNPVMVSYAVVTTTGAHLFVEKKKLSAEVLSHLNDGTVEGETKVVIHDYDTVTSFVKAAVEAGTAFAVDKSQLNWGLYIAAGGSKTIPLISPLAMAKSLKNEVEQNGIRQSHIRDGVALTAFLHWLERTVTTGETAVSEYDVAVKVEEFRHKMADHVGPSFATIAGYGSNGAVIHYKPEKDTAKILTTDSMFLLDSGGQYLDGTTDVTRTLHFGAATQRMKDCYTMVLKGHVGLASLVFPEGTIGSRIDAMARAPLWRAGLDYNHGTGHGVGAFLNVHEGPQGIGVRKRENEAGFAIGMTTSNEPGYYEVGNFGIRIENVCITVEAQTENSFGGKKFCAFETVTMTPIKTSLLNVQMLNQPELDWINAYHENVRQKLLPLMRESFPESVDYLIAETEPISK